MIRKLFGRVVLGALCLGLLLGICLPAAAEESPVARAGIQLSEEEQAFVDAHGPFRVGFVQDRIPVSFSDENGELAGVSRYLFDRLAQLSGLTFEYVPLPAGSITYDFLMDQKLDLVTSVEYNKENLNARGIVISQPYLSSRKVVVARQDLEFDTSKHLKVAVSTGSQTLRKVLGRLFPNFELEDYASITDCFDALLRGEADLLIQNQFVVEYWMAKPAYEKLKVIPVMGLEDELCFSAVFSFDGGDGPTEDDGRLLVGILNRAIDLITEDESGSYIIQAVMKNQYNYTLGDFLSRYRYAVGIFIVSVIIIVVLATILMRLRLRTLADQADAKAKGQFISAMSHEIRTPLNGLIGLNYLIAQRLDDRAQLERYLQQSTSTARYLLRLVSEMLDMSSMQKGALKLSPAPMDLALSVSTVEALAGRSMSDRGLEFHADVELPYPHILGDAVRVQQVLLNLLDNARKFTSAGGKVSLTAQQTLQEDGSIRTRFAVEDNGVGMSEEFQKQVFDTFAQERETVSQGNQGMGLGLPVSHSLAQLMGGDITFTSKKGEGSTFYFTFTAQPAKLPKEQHTLPTPAQPEKGRPHVLVVEDNDLNREIMQELLEEEGFPVTLAEDGQEAVELFRNSPPNTYEVILMDLLMPRMDGYEATAAIRALGREDGKKVRIIACTANSSGQERSKVLASGLDDFISKPVDRDLLLEKLALRNE